MQPSSKHKSVLEPALLSVIEIPDRMAIVPNKIIIQPLFKFLIFFSNWFDCSFSCFYFLFHREQSSNIPIEWILFGLRFSMVFQCETLLLESFLKPNATSISILIKQ